MSWKWVNADRLVVFRVNPDGSLDSRAAVVLSPAELAAVLDPDPPPPPSQDDLDRIAAKQYAKLQALAAMTPAEVQAWCAANITDLASAKDALTTLAIAVSVLVRRL